MESDDCEFGKGCCEPGCGSLESCEYVSMMAGVDVEEVFGGGRNGLSIVIPSSYH